MNTSELIAYARETATIDDDSTEFPASVVMQLMNSAMRTYFEPIVAEARSGYWLHTVTRTLAAGNPLVRLPPRHVALEQLDIRQNGGDWIALTECIESELQDWEREWSRASTPQGYTLRGSYVYLSPAASTADIQLRAKVTVRPSQLVLDQTAGRVTAVDTATRTITVNELPVDRVTGEVVSGSLVIDVIEPRGWFELSLFDALAGVSGPTTFQVSSGPSLGRIEVGDYVRVAGQTDWPQLPESYHTVLGAAAAIPICVRRDMYDRSTELQGATSAAAQRLAASLTPRTRATTHMPLQHGWR